MLADGIYTATLLDHVSHPDHNETISPASHTQQGVNPSCGDDLTLTLNIEDGLIKALGWTGSGCAISKGSADIMSDLLVGLSVEEAKHLSFLFEKMVRGEALTQEEKDELDEAYDLESISRMPARVKCAELAWRTLDKVLASVS